MQRVARVTVPGLSVRRDFETARRRLLADFSGVDEIVATTAPATLLVLYSGPDELDAWIDALLDSVATRPRRGPSTARSRRGTVREGDDSAA